MHQRAPLLLSFDREKIYSRNWELRELVGHHAAVREREREREEQEEKRNKNSTTQSRSPKQQDEARWCSWATMHGAWYLDTVPFIKFRRTCDLATLLSRIGIYLSILYL